MKLSTIPSLRPELFFQVKHICHQLKSKDSVIKKGYQLEPLPQFELEDLAIVHIAWSQDSFHLFFDIDKPIEKTESDYRKSDSVELFFDTRDNKQKNIVSRFCHHFAIYPEKVDGSFFKEVTRFRGEDMHPIAAKDTIEVIVSVKKKSYSMQIKIKAEALHGYQPSEFDQLGFCYRVNQVNLDPVGFYAPFDTIAIEKHPSSWSSLLLKN